MNDKANEEVIVPTVGMGATECHPSDRYPYTVIEVITPRKIVVQADTYRWAGDDFEYTLNPNGTTYVVTLRKDGKWRVQNCTQRFHVGSKRFYQSPEI